MRGTWLLNVIERVYRIIMGYGNPEGDVGLERASKIIVIVKTVREIMFAVLF